MAVKKKTGGRPKSEIDQAEVEKLASFMFTKAEIAAWLGIHRATFYRRCKADQELKDALERGYERGKASLRRTQFQKALEGDKTMLVWLGKQYLGQKDRQEVETRDLPQLFVTEEPSKGDDHGEELEN